jgi:hypothetical protein
MDDFAMLFKPDYTSGKKYEVVMRGLQADSVGRQNRIAIQFIADSQSRPTGGQNRAVQEALTMLAQ